MSRKIGLFFGSDTGITEEITHDVVEFFDADTVDVTEISDASATDIEGFDSLIFGLSTWYDGDLQSDWETFYEDEFQDIDFTGKKVALFGLGDQVGYAEYFIDGVGILAETILKNGGEIVGKWPVEGYRHTESKAIIEDDADYFYGLALDNDNESELNTERLEAWIPTVKEELL